MAVALIVPGAPDQEVARLPLDLSAMDFRPAAFMVQGTVEARVLGMFLTPGYKTEMLLHWREG